MDLGRPGEGEPLLLRALQIEPSEAKTWRFLGQARDKLGKVPEAIDAYRQGVAADPRDYRLLADLGWALLRQAQTDVAARRFHESLEYRDDYPPALNGLAGALVAQGRTGEAERLYRSALSEDPNDPIAKKGLAAIAATGVR